MKTVGVERTSRRWASLICAASVLTRGRRSQASSQLIAVQAGGGGDADDVVVRRVGRRLGEDLIVVWPELPLLVRAHGAESELTRAVVNGAREGRVTSLVQGVVLEVDGDPAVGLRHVVRERAGKVAAVGAHEVRELDHADGRLVGSFERSPVESQLVHRFLVELSLRLRQLIFLILLWIVERSLELSDFRARVGETRFESGECRPRRRRL